LKIAILYSGNIRSFEKTKFIHISFIENLVSQGNDVRVFCQTWDSIESNTESWWKKSSYSSDNVVPTQLRVLKPQILKIEKNLIFSADSLHVLNGVLFENLYSMYFSWSSAYREYVKYSETEIWYADVLIKLRYDIDFDFRPFIDLIKTSNFNIVAVKSKYYNDFKSFSDCVFLLKNKRSNLFIFDMCNFLMNSSLIDGYKAKFNKFIPEIFLSQILNANCDITVVDIDLNIIRLNGEAIIVNSANDEFNLSLTIGIMCDVFRPEILLRELRMILDKVGLKRYQFLFYMNPM